MILKKLEVVIFQFKVHHFKTKGVPTTEPKSYKLYNVNSPTPEKHIIKERNVPCLSTGWGWNEVEMKSKLQCKPCHAKERAKLQTKVLLLIDSGFRFRDHLYHRPQCQEV